MSHLHWNALAVAVSGKIDLDRSLVSLAGEKVQGFWASCVALVQTKVYPRKNVLSSRHPTRALTFQDLGKTLYARQGQGSRGTLTTSLIPSSSTLMLYVPGNMPASSLAR